MKDLTGKRFGRWTVVGVGEKRKNGDSGTRIYWHCISDCLGESNMRKIAFFLLGILSVRVLVYLLFKEQVRVSMKPMKPLRCDGGMRG